MQVPVIGEGLRRIKSLRYGVLLLNGLLFRSPLNIHTVKTSRYFSCSMMDGIGNAERSQRDPLLERTNERTDKGTIHHVF